MAGDQGPVAKSCLENMKPYEPGKPIEEVERELGIKDVIKMASNENPLGPSPKACEAIREVAERVSLYPDGHCYYLRESLAKHLNIGADHLIIGNGSDEILKLLAETYLHENDETVMASPSFSEYAFVTQLMGGKVNYVPTDKEFRHDLPRMLDAINEKTKMVFICNPNNPTGTIVKKKEVQDFLQKVPAHVLVVFDEAYHEYAVDDEYPDGIEFVKEGRKNVIALRTFSKIYGLAGLRVGYGVAVPEMLSWVVRTKEPFNVNLVAQAAARKALQDEEHVLKSREVNEAGKKFIYEALTAMNLEYIPTKANFIMVDTGVNSRNLFHSLLRKGLIVRTGDIFGMDTWIRVTIGTPEQNKFFIETLRVALKELQ